MKIISGNIFDPVHKLDAICVTTNGYVTSSGKCVMGAGIAREAKERFPGIDLKLGKLIIKNGNIPNIINTDPVIISFPTKPSEFILTKDNSVHPYNRNTTLYGKACPGFMSLSRIDIIVNSVKELYNIMNNNLGLQRVGLPKPGCENGGLIWNEVSAVLSDYLDDRIIIFTKER